MLFMLLVQQIVLLGTMIQLIGQSRHLHLSSYLALSRSLHLPSLPSNGKAMSIAIAGALYSCFQSVPSSVAQPMTRCSSSGTFDTTFAIWHGSP